MAVQPTITRPTLPAAEHLIPRENGYGVHEVAAVTLGEFRRSVGGTGAAFLWDRAPAGAAARRRGVGRPAGRSRCTSCLGGHYGELPMLTRQDFDEALSTPTATRIFWIVAINRPDASFS